MFILLSFEGVSNMKIEEKDLSLQPIQTGGLSSFLVIAEIQPMMVW